MDRSGRQDLQLLDARIGLGVGAAPAAIQSAIMRYSARVGGEPHAPLCGDGAGGLRQHQAAAGIGQLDRRPRSCLTMLK